MTIESKTDGLFLDAGFLRSRGNAKWQKYPADILPAWIAETDLSVAEPIRATLAALVDKQDFGYPNRGTAGPDAAIAAAFAKHSEARHGWAPDPAQIRIVTSLDQALIAALLAFTNEGDGILVQTPCYPPFYDVIALTGRQLVAHPLRNTSAGFKLDLDTLDEAASRARAIILCNPHNPTGHVFSETELRAVAAVADRHDLIIFSDEVHADIVYDGLRHRPIADLDPAIAARTLTASAPCKAFNIPGLRCGVVHLGSASLAERFDRRIPLGLLGQPGVTGIDGTVAAWEQSGYWLDATMIHLDRMRGRTIEALNALPSLHMHSPEATFLGWIDCSGLGLKTTAADFFLAECRVAMMPGEMFDSGYSQWVRLNFGTTAPLLEQMLERIEIGVRRAL